MAEIADINYFEVERLMRNEEEMQKARTYFQLFRDRYPREGEFVPSANEIARFYLSERYEIVDGVPTSTEKTDYLERTDNGLLFDDSYVDMYCSLYARDVAGFSFTPPTIPLPTDETGRRLTDERLHRRAYMLNEKNNRPTAYTSRKETVNGIIEHDELSDRAFVEAYSKAYNLDDATASIDEKRIFVLTQIKSHPNFYAARRKAMYFLQEYEDSKPLLEHITLDPTLTSRFSESQLNALKRMRFASDKYMPDGTPKSTYNPSVDKLGDKVEMFTHNIGGFEVAEYLFPFGNDNYFVISDTNGVSPENRYTVTVRDHDGQILTYYPAVDVNGNFQVQESAGSYYMTVRDGTETKRIKLPFTTENCPNPRQMAARINHMPSGSLTDANVWRRTELDGMTLEAVVPAPQLSAEIPYTPVVRKFVETTPDLTRTHYFFGYTEHDRDGNLQSRQITIIHNQETASRRAYYSILVTDPVTGESKEMQLTPNGRGPSIRIENGHIVAAVFTLESNIELVQLPASPENCESLQALLNIPDFRLIDENNPATYENSCRVVDVDETHAQQMHSVCPDLHWAKQPYVEIYERDEAHRYYLFPYEQDGMTRFLQVDEELHEAPEEGAPVPPPTYSVTVTNPMFGLRETYQIIPQPNPFNPAEPGNLFTYSEITGKTTVRILDHGRVHDVELPLSPENCSGLRLANGAFPLEHLGHIPFATFARDYGVRIDAPVFEHHTTGLAASMEYTLPGSNKNLVSKVGDVSYIYLPCPRPGGYLRVMQKNGNLYLNLNGMDREHPDRPTTCRIVSVGYAPVEGRPESSFLTFELSYGGRRHRLAFPVPESENVHPLINDLQRLINHENIQLNAIRDWERPNVPNQQYDAEMEQPIERTPPTHDGPDEPEPTPPDEPAPEPTPEPNITGLRYNKGGEGRKTGQNLEQVTFALPGTAPRDAIRGLSETVALNESMGFTTGQKISVYNNYFPLDTGNPLNKMLASVSKGDTVVAYVTKTIDETSGEEVKSLQISENYIGEFLAANPALAEIISDKSPVDGFYSFDVANIRLTANGLMKYGIQVNGREIAVNFTSVGCQMVDREGSRGALRTTETPFDMGFSIELLDDIYKGKERTQTEFVPQDKSQSVLMDNLLYTATRVLRQQAFEAAFRRGDLIEPTHIELSLPTDENPPKVKLHSYKIVEKDGTPQFISVMEREGKTYMYVKTDRAYPAWVEVRSARLAKSDPKTPDMSDTALLFELGDGRTKLTTISLPIDVGANADVLREMKGSRDIAGAFATQFDRPSRTTEAESAEVSYWDSTDGRIKEISTGETPPENGFLVYPRTAHETSSTAEFSLIREMQQREVERPHDSPPPTPPTPPAEDEHEDEPELDEEEIPELIQDPSVVKKPAEKEPEEWKPKPPMTGTRNTLLGLGMLALLLSVLFPPLQIIAVALGISAAVVEIEPWNMIGQARQRKLEDAQNALYDKEHEFEIDMNKTKEQVSNRQHCLATAERRLAQARENGVTGRRLHRLEAALNRQKLAVFKAQQHAETVVMRSRKFNKDREYERQRGLVSRQESENEELRERGRQRINQAREQDIAAGERTREELENLRALESRDEGTLTEEERERLRRLRGLFRRGSAAENAVSSEIQERERYLAQAKEIQARIRAEKDQIDAELSRLEDAEAEEHPAPELYADISSDGLEIFELNVEEKTNIPGATTDFDQADDMLARRGRRSMFDRGRDR